MADVLTVAQATDSPLPLAARRADMLHDWQQGMRQVDIAAKYGCSQGAVSKLIGGTPRSRAAEPDAAEYRARALLALALINHRRTDDGLSVSDTSAVKAALLGVWDEAVA